MGVKEDLLSEGYKKTPFGYVKGVKLADNMGIEMHIARMDPETMDRGPDDVELLDLQYLQDQKTTLEKRLSQVNGKIQLYNQTMAAP